MAMINKAKYGAMAMITTTSVANTVNAIIVPIIARYIRLSN